MSRTVSKPNVDPWVKLDLRLVTDRNLTDLDFRLLALLVAQTRVIDGARTSAFTLSVSEISRKLGRERETVIGRLRALEALEIVRPLERMNGKSARHDLRIEQYLEARPVGKIRQVKQTEPVGKIRQVPVGKLRQVGSQTCPPNPTPVAPQNQYKEIQKATPGITPTANDHAEPHGLARLPDSDSASESEALTCRILPTGSDFYAEHGLGLAPEGAGLDWIVDSLYEATTALGRTDTPNAALLAEWRAFVPQVVVAVEMVLARQWHAERTHVPVRIRKPVPYVAAIVANADLPSQDDRVIAKTMLRERMVEDFASKLTRDEIKRVAPVDMRDEILAQQERKHAASRELVF